MKTRFHIRTVGCRTNQADTLELTRLMQARGAIATAEAAEADLIVVNSCAVTSRAARDVRRIVGQVRRACPHARVIVTGCLVEVEKQELFTSLGADAVIGCADKMTIVDLVGAGHEPGEGPLMVFRPPLKVQEGCDHGCTYCIVPSTRGPERSIDLDTIVRAVADLARRGVHEVVLTGTQLGGWGAQLDPVSKLSTLVEVLTSERLVHRIRLSSIEPWGVDDRLVEMLGGHRQGLCRHLHIPLQSGSDRILEMMNRPYTAGEWSRIAERVVPSDSSVGLGTDVIVGFPGETQADFERTRDVLGEAPLSYIHVFPFSARAGTDAALMADGVSDRVARERVAALRELSRRLNRRFVERLEGRTLEAVIETRHAPSGGMLATTSEYARVLVTDATTDHRGRLALVELDGIRDDRAVGRLVEVMK